MLNRDERTQVANTILEQLGGMPNLVMMTGAKNFIINAKGGVKFNVGRNAKGVHRVEIALNAMDTYDVGFYGRNESIKDYKEGVYFDQLKDIFEAATGMYLTLFPRSHS